MLGGAPLALLGGVGRISSAAAAAPLPSAPAAAGVLGAAALAMVACVSIGNCGIFNLGAHDRGGASQATLTASYRSSGSAIQCREQLSDDCQLTVRALSRLTTLKINEWFPGTK